MCYVQQPAGGQLVQLVGRWTAPGQGCSAMLCNQQEEIAVGHYKEVLSLPKWDVDQCCAHTSTPKMHPQIKHQQTLAALAGVSATAIPSPKVNTHYAECFLVQIIVLIFSNGDWFTPRCNVDGTLRSLPFTSRFGFTTFRLYKEKLHTSHDEPD